MLRYGIAPLLVLILGICLDTQAATAVVPRKISLKQAVQLATELSPSYQTAKNQLQVSELEVKNALSAFFPSLDLSASHGLRGLEPDTAGVTTQTRAVSGTTLSLTENFYDNGESSKKKKIADFRWELAKLNFANIRGQVLRNVVLAYYRHNISLQNLRFTEKNFTEFERLSKLVSNQFYQGLKTRKDFLRFRSQSQRALLSVNTSKENFLKARNELLETIGLSARDSVQFDEQVQPLFPQKQVLQDVNLETLYEYRTLALQQEIGRLEVDLAKRKFWPELSLVGAASYGSSNYIDTRQTWSDNDIAQWSVLLNLKFNLIDWGVRSRNIQIASANQNTTEQGLRDQLLKSQSELELFKLQIRQSEENYRLSKELQKMEEDTFKILERDYRSGQATYLELASGLQNLLDAQSRGLEADYNQADIYLQWKYYKGILNEETVLQ